MKYIIMAGGQYENLKTPKHLLKVNGEVIIERTIRLLKKYGIEDINISTNNSAFDYLGVPILKHNNDYKYGKEIIGYWTDAFYPTDEPTCYIFGDVYFSEDAIKKIIETPTDDIEFFGSKEPFATNYPKNWVEPFALKVVNTDHLKASIKKTIQLSKEGKLYRKHPIMWELWTVIKDAPLQTQAGKYTADYIAINDYTSDIDDKRDIERLEYFLKGGNMVRAKVLEEFTLGRFGELRNIKRARKDEKGKLFVGDEFECANDLADYLTGKNAYNKPFVKVLEVIPTEPVKEVKVETSEKIKPDVKIEVTPKKRNRKKK